MKFLVRMFLLGLLCLALTACGPRGSGLPGALPVDSAGGERGETASDSEGQDQQQEDSSDSPSPSCEMGEGTPERAGQGEEKENESMRMNVQVGDAVFSATLEENEAARALAEQMAQAPVVIEMRDYAGFEKVGPLGMSLPSDDHQTTTQPGDIVLYGGSQIVIFYGPNSWSYTRLGRIDDLTGWEQALGGGDVTVVFSLA